MQRPCSRVVICTRSSGHVLVLRILEDVYICKRAAVVATSPYWRVDSLSSLPRSLQKQGEGTVLAALLAILGGSQLAIL